MSRITVIVLLYRYLPNYCDFPGIPACVSLISKWNFFYMAHTESSSLFTSNSQDWRHEVMASWNWSVKLRTSQESLLFLCNIFMRRMTLIFLAFQPLSLNSKRNYADMPAPKFSSAFTIEVKETFTRKTEEIPRLVKFGNEAPLFVAQIDLCF